MNAEFVAGVLWAYDVAGTPFLIDEYKAIAKRFCVDQPQDIELWLRQNMEIRRDHKLPDLVKQLEELF